MNSCCTQMLRPSPRESSNAALNLKSEASTVAAVHDVYDRRGFCKLLDCRRSIARRFYEVVSCQPPIFIPARFFFGMEQFNAFADNRVIVSYARSCQGRASCARRKRTLDGEDV